MKVEMMDIGAIKPDPKQPRKNFDREKLKESSESYRHHGTIVPIEIDENNRIIVGELRWRSCKLAGLKQVPCVRKTGLTPEQRIERQLVENLNRQDLKMVDIIPQLKKLLNHIASNMDKDKKHPYDEGVTELARRLGVNQGWLSGILKIDREAPQEVKEALKKNEIKTKIAVEMQSLKPETQKRILPELKETKGREVARQKIRDAKKLEKLEELEKDLPETEKILIPEIKKTPQDYVDEINTKLMETWYLIGVKLPSNKKDEILKWVSDHLTSEQKKELIDTLEVTMAGIQNFLNYLR